MVASLAVPRLAGWLERDAHRGIAVELLEARGSWIGLFVVAAALSAYVGASGIATRVFERAAARARDPLHAARRLVHRADGWATGASIAGLATPVVGFGMIEVAVGHSGLLALFAHADGIAAIRHLTLGSLRGAFAAIVAGAVIVAWYSDARWLRRTAWTVPAGLVLAFVTCLIGARLDVGPLVVTIAGGARPSPAMRIALTATGTVAVFLATAGLVLRTRRREAAAIARAAGSAQPVR
jgi:hypothetical protein